MGTSWDEILATVREHLGSSAGMNLAQARVISEQRLASLRELITASPEVAKLACLGSYAVIGSLGRLESLEASDVDLILCCKDGVDPESPEIRGLDQLVRQKVRDGLGLEVSKGDNLTSPASLRQIASVDHIGGDRDDGPLLTKRTLIMTESRGVADDNLRSNLRSGIFDAYFGSTKTKGKNLLSVINDIVRFYRTVCVDYKSRVDAEGKPWAIRNLKLRHARKYWYLSSMLALVAVAAQHEESPDVAEAEAIEILDRTPTERLVFALRRARLEHQLAIVTYYDRFLGSIGEEATRQELEGVSHERRFESVHFRTLHDNSKNLHRAMLELVDALPPNWRRHVLSHFLF